jgi:hypothetical protein
VDDDAIQEAAMSTTEVGPDDATGGPSLGKVALKLEAVVIPVSDADRAKAFYGALAGGSTLTSPSTTASG